MQTLRIYDIKVSPHEIDMSKIIICTQTTMIILLIKDSIWPKNKQIKQPVKQGIKMNFKNRMAFQNDSFSNMQS
jgi:hypothetical protein